MGNHFMKTGKSVDKSFLEEQEALDYAKDMSDKNHSNRFVIKCEEQYFVSTTDNVQSYEKLIAAYKSGNRVLLQP